jgi:hypothetical protein
MSEVRVPDAFGISAAAQAAARAARSPDLTAPKSAKVTLDKNGKKHSRWIETGVVESAYRKGSSKGNAVIYNVGVRFRAGEPNFPKVGWFMLTIHEGVAKGLPTVTEAERRSYGNLTERNIGTLLTLLDVTGFTPKSGELTGALLGALFPPKGGKSPLQSKPVTVKIHQQPTNMENADRLYDMEAEGFVSPIPAAEVTPETPAATGLVR